MSARIHFSAAQLLPAAPEALFSFFMQPQNIRLLTPPGMRVQVVSTTHDPLAEGAEITYIFHKFGLPLRWRARITDVQPGLQFTDEQLRGPFRYWRHCHRLIPAPGGGCTVQDDITLELPFGALGRLVWRWFLRRDVARTFAARQQVLARLCEEGAL